MDNGQKGVGTTDLVNAACGITNNACISGTPDNKPGFFRDIIYKGETFPKYNVWDPIGKGEANAAPR